MKPISSLRFQRDLSDLWVATRATRLAAFNAPVNLGSAVNSTVTDGETVAISADNLILIFYSPRSGGLGSGDLWITTRTNAQAPWRPAHNLGAPVNSAAFEVTPCLSPDGLLLFFASDRHASGKASLWVSRRVTADAAFGPPALIKPIADRFPAGTSYFSLSADGTTLYFNTYTNYPFGSSLRQVSITPLPQLSAPRMTGIGEFQFELLGREGATYELQTSPDLSTWRPWLKTNAAGSVTLADPASAPEGRRFYRAVSH